jgi:hypothetical protein
MHAKFKTFNLPNYINLPQNNADIIKEPMAAEPMKLRFLVLSYSFHPNLAVNVFSV